MILLPGSWCLVAWLHPWPASMACIHVRVGLSPTVTHTQATQQNEVHATIFLGSRVNIMRASVSAGPMHLSQGCTSMGRLFQNQMCSLNLQGDASGLTGMITSHQPGHTGFLLGLRAGLHQTALAHQQKPCCNRPLPGSSLWVVLGLSLQSGSAGPCCPQHSMEHSMERGIQPSSGLNHIQMQESTAWGSGVPCCP